MILIDLGTLSQRRTVATQIDDATTQFLSAREDARMSHAMLAAVRSLRRETIRPTERLVALILADCHNAETGRCDPSIDRLVNETSLCRRAVIASIQRMAKAGHLTVESGGVGRRSSYRLHPCTPCTSAANAPVQDMHGTGAPDAPPPVHAMHKTGAPDAPKLERTGNRTGNKPEATAAQPPGGKVKPQDIDDDFQAACGVELEMTSPPAVKSAWNEWQVYRQQRHTAKGVQRLPWTLQAARLSAELRPVEHDLAGIILDFVFRHARTHSGISGGFKGRPLLQSGVHHFPETRSRSIFISSVEM